MLRIHRDGGRADDLSFTPMKAGTAEVTESGYVLRFELLPPPGPVLVFRINRFTGQGTRELFAPDGKAVPGHGGYDLVACKPFTGSPL